MASPSSFQLGWLDANMYSQQNQDLLKKIREINPGALEYAEKDEFLRFLRSSLSDPRPCVLIVSGAFGEKLVPEIVERENIVSIYVYCGNRS